MSVIYKISELLNGHQTTVDLSANTLNIGGLEIGGTPISQAEATAFFTGVIPGTATSVTITANNPGAIGNSVALVFTGSNTIAAEIATWNGAHPSNQVTLTSGNGSQTPSSQTVNLAGGLDSGSTLIGDTAIYVNFTPTSATVAGALAGIDAALVNAGNQPVDIFTLDGTDITNKFVTLSTTPLIPAATILIVENAPGMFFGVDFTVSGNQFSWSSLALDGVLGSGDKLTVTYKA